jgi:prostaglandin-endoperoxide synthase 2
MSQMLLDRPPQQEPAAAVTPPSTPRSKERDGRRNRMQFWMLTHGPGVWRTLQRHARTERFVNRYLVDQAVGKTPPRPYGLSTKSGYTSWSSLTDKSYSARQLPPSPERDLPPAQDVADLFLRREREALPCPKSTVLFAHMAQWFTDGFLRTKRPTSADDTQPRDISRNISTHEVDLCQLYGSTPTVTEALRAHKGGRLKSEIFNGEEIPPRLCDANGIKEEFTDLDPVPRFKHLSQAQKRALFAMGSDVANTQIGYCMFNVLFLREHNRIAGELAAAYPEWDDERLFQTARAILTVLLIRLAIEEYINHIAPYHFKFKLRPGSFERSSWMRPNWESVEFNLLYRWHSLIPDTMRAGGRDLPIEETVFRNDLLFAKGLGPLFAEASEQRACRIGLFNTATYFKNATMASVRQARAVNLAPYNDYRALVGLPRVTDFDQISSRPDVREALKATYGHVDEIEFYVGLFAEDNRPNSAIGPLTGTLVGVHAFSQLMTNPLLAPNVFNQDTFSPLGWEMIHGPLTLRDLLNRNVPAGSPLYAASLTRRGWERE